MTKDEAISFMNKLAAMDEATSEIIAQHWIKASTMGNLAEMFEDGSIYEASVSCIIFSLMRSCRMNKKDFGACLKDANDLMDKALVAVSVLRSPE